MSDTTERGPVVLGVAGAAANDVALQWAIDEARSRTVPLRIVSAFAWEFTRAAEVRYDLPSPERGRLSAHAHGLVRATAERAAALAPDLTVSAEAIEGAAVPVMVAESEQASVVVIGSRRSPVLGRTLLGALTAGLVERAHCPVVVARGDSVELIKHPGVVVGVDDTESSDAVLRFAFDFASRRQVPLRAVLCWSARPIDALISGTEPSPESARRWLAEAVAGWRDKYPDVRYFGDLSADHAVAGLAAASVGEQLLVVGSHHSRCGSGARVGSTASGVLHHANCPVVIIPASERCHD